MRVLLVSTYELGHQPLGIAGPAGALRAAGHAVRARDVAVEAFEDADAGWADAVAFSVPMHTALRLALPLVERVRAARPELPVALHGLYAPVGAGHPALGAGDLLVAGDTTTELLRWVAELETRQATTAGGPRVAVELGRPRGRPAPAPDRSSLPPLASYARLLTGDGPQLAGYVEASTGCSHRCRHCPVPTVYDGRTRPVDVETVVADVERLVAAGARHVTFGDPDFLNRPRHSLEVVRRVHAAFPQLTFDATVKVEHVLAHRQLWDELAAAGLLFVVSAFESVDDRVLGLLDKGHNAADAGRAVSVLRAAGVEPRPSFLPFTPWTELPDLLDLLRFVIDHDLVPNVDPVQYGIRLLLPPGSLLLRDPDPQLAASLRGYDPSALSWSWQPADPRVDALQAAVAAIAERAGAAGAAPEESFTAIAEVAWRAARAAGADAGERPPAPADAPDGAGTQPARPRLSESWYCCAEPTGRQLAAVERT